MIKDFHVGMYRGLQNLELNELKDINIIVGPNNCGKTSILESIILSGLFEDVDLLVNTLVSRYHGFNTEYFESIFPIEKEPVICLKSRLNDDKILHTHLLYQKSQMINKDEPTHLSNIFELQFSYRYDGVVEEDDKPDIFKVRFEESDDNYQIKLGKSSQNIIDIKIPCKYVSFSRFSSSENLIEDVDKVLDQNLRQDLIDILNVFDTEIENFEVIGKGRTIKLFKKDKLTPLTLHDYGNGMYKAFFIATSALLARNGVLLIDEIEAGIHSKALRSFMAKLLKVCFDNNVQLFLTTHSLEAIDIILEDCDGKLDKTAVYHIKNKENQTLAKRYSGGKLFDLRKEIGFDVR